MLISDPRHTDCLNLADGLNIYAIMKTMFPEGYCENNLGNPYTWTHDIPYIYNYIYIYIYIMYIYIYNYIYIVTFLI